MLLGDVAREGASGLRCDVLGDVRRKMALEIMMVLRNREGREGVDCRGSLVVGGGRTDGPVFRGDNLV